MKTGELDFELPQRLIAQQPVSPRDQARLLVYDPSTKEVKHEYFSDLPKFLEKGDVLVFNNSKVFKARLFAAKPTGGRVEVFLLNSKPGQIWEVLLGGRGLKPELELKFDNNLKAVLKKKLQDSWLVEFNRSSSKILDFSNKHGQVPLPPYIKSSSSLHSYQTIYAKRLGSVAAPTAGLHFTKQLLKKLSRKGIQIEFVTLHVGLGTFQPIKTTDVETHRIHSEYAEIDNATCKRLNSAKRAGRKIIAVGTTSVRTLEAFSNPQGILKPGKKDVKIYIYPPYVFKFVDGLITNFHLPKSTLLLLVSSFISWPKLLALYKQSISKKYRFFSFGDGMFILPKRSERA